MARPVVDPLLATMPGRDLGVRDETACAFRHRHFRRTWSRRTPLGREGSRLESDRAPGRTQSARRSESTRSERD